MKLVVDIGNSRLKWARWDAGGLGTGEYAERREPPAALLDGLWAGLGPPGEVLVSSVAGATFDAEIEAWMAARWGIRPEWFRAEPHTLGISNAYADHARLGSDRWAAVLGARDWERGAVAVIDCGTAVTLDVLDAEDHHLGGWIFPGVALSQRSLLTRTASVREASPRMAGELGRSTAECVANGTLLGVAGVLDRWMTVVARQVDDVAWIATGGDWPRLRALIDRPVRHDPDLVLRGLARVLAHRR